MSEERPRHDSLVVLRHPGFRLYLTSRALSTTGLTLLQAVMAWQVYEISGSALNLGILGIVRFLPALGLGLIGGAVADRYNRRNLVIAGQFVGLACTGVLAISTMGGWVSLGVIYSVVLVMGVASALDGPSGGSLLASIMPAELFPRAVTLNSTMQALGRVTGPAISGAIIGTAGVDIAYLTYIGLLIGSVSCMAFIRYGQTARGRATVSVPAILEGIRFVRRHQVLLGAMSLDMFAVVFGGAVALLPIYATDILHVGAGGYGLLTASFEVGAVLMSLALVVRPPIVQAGRALLVTVAIFGIGTIVFGLSRTFEVSLVTYMFIGMADQLSVVLRQTTIQLSTPDELRGRVSAVSQIFIQTSNQLGAAESGVVAAATSATFAVVSGGAACLAVVGVVATRLPELRTYRIEQAGAEIEPIPPAPAPKLEPQAGD